MLSLATRSKSMYVLRENIRNMSELHLIDIGKLSTTAFHLKWDREEVLRDVDKNNEPSESNSPESNSSESNSPEPSESNSPEPSESNSSEPSESNSPEPSESNSSESNSSESKKQLKNLVKISCDR